MAWLRPDSKTQVSVQYENGQPVRIVNVVVSTQHSADVKHKEIKDFIIKEIVRKGSCRRMLDKETHFLINPTGRFVVGGPQGDTGLTGRKIIVDSLWRHGAARRRRLQRQGPSKVDRSAAYMGRYVAKNIVAAGLATRAEIQFAYAIGYPDPVSVCVDTFGTGRSERRKDRAGRARGVQFQAGRHHQAAQSAAPDLLQDHQLRPLWQN